MYDNWRSLQKNSKITADIYRKKEMSLLWSVMFDCLFDIAHSDALPKYNEN